MLANKPPLGWNTWNTFGENISEQLIVETVEIMANEGYRDAGYRYIIIDDCWALSHRDSNGKLVVDYEKFPSGLKYLAEYIHSNGFKFGLYASAGVLTGSGYPGSYGHEYIDAKTFAEWGIDYLKYDCSHFPRSGDAINAYLTMSLALRSSGRKILLAACNRGMDDSSAWMRNVGAHTYRSTDNIFDDYSAIKDIALSQEFNLAASGPGCFNDLDMLVVGMQGNGNVGFKHGCTDGEYRIHFAFWAMYGTPLIIGSNLRKISRTSKELLLNKELIRINQDEDARPPVVLDCGHDKDCNENTERKLFKLLSDNEYALMAANLSDSEKPITFYFAEMGIPYSSGMGLELSDVFTGENLGVVSDFLTVNIKAHDCTVLRGKLVKMS